MRSYSLVLMLVVAVLGLTGCSSDSALVTEAASPTSATQFLAGKLFLGVDVANTTVSAVSLDGTRLATTTTDATGNYYLRTALPADFRMVAEIPGITPPVATEVRGFKERGYVVLNIPNTLVSQYMAARPGTSLEQAQAWAQAQLALTPGTGLFWMEDGPRAAFSHLAFLVAAARSGGWALYTGQVVNSPSPVGPYVLRTGALQASFAGLEPALASLAAATQRQPRLVASTRASYQEQLLNLRVVAGPMVILQRGVGSVLLTGVGSAIVSDVTKSLIGWVTTSLGWNIGTAGKLNEIQNTLNEMVAELGRIASEGGIEITSTNLSNAVSSTNTLVTMQGNAINAATSNGTVNPGNVPNPTLQSNNTTSALASSLSGYPARVDLNDFADAMLGQNGVQNLVLATLGSQLVNQFGIQTGGSGGTMPVRSSFLLDQTLATLTFYGGQQSLICNFLVENAHSAPGTPAGALNAVAEQVAPAAYSLAVQRQQLPPYPISDNVMVDLQNGLMWYTQLQSAATWDEANNAAQSYALPCNGGSLGAWRLPTALECYTLAQRGRYVAKNQRDSQAPQNGSNDSYGNYGYVVQGLSAGSSGNKGLGFTGMDNINSDGNMWFYAWSFVNDTYSTEDAEGSYYRINHESQNTDHAGGSTKYPYLMVRSLGPTILPAASNEGFIGGTGVNGPPGMNFDDLNDAEFAAEGYPTSFDGADGVSFASGPITGSVGAPNSTNTISVNTVGDFVQARILYSLTVGGSFKYGQSGSETSQTNPTQNLTADGPILLGGRGGFFTDLQPPLAFSVTSGSDNVTVSNYEGLQGLLSWHAASNNTLSAQVSVTVNGVQGAGNLTKQTPPVRGLVSLLVAPRNHYLPNSQLGNGTQQFYCTGYYSDQSVADLTNNVTWSVVNNATQAPNQAVRFGTASSSSSLIVQNLTPPTSTSQGWFQVTASLNNATLPGGSTGNLSDSTLIQLGDIGSPNAPTISSLTPTFGPTAGGTAVVIAGTNFTGATSVTFGGKAASFTVNTNGQISAIAPSASAQGTVPIVVTTPGGSASANFTYN